MLTRGAAPWALTQTFAHSLIQSMPCGHAALSKKRKRIQAPNLWYGECKKCFHAYAQREENDVLVSSLQIDGDS